MADRTKIIRRRPVEPEEAEDMEAAVDEAEAVEEEEVEVEVPAPRKPRTVVVDDDDEDTPPAKKAAPAPVAKKAAPVAAKPVSKPAPKVVVEDDEEEPAKPAPKAAAPAKVGNLSEMQIQSVLLMTAEALEVGKSIVITRTGEDKWSVTSGAAVAAAAPAASGKPKLSGKAYWEMVCTKEYLEWQEDWLKMTPDERMAEIKRAKVKWEVADNDLVNNMRATTAYMEKMGIEKYKDEFKTPSSRAAIKG